MPTDLARLQGSWSIATLEINGALVPAGEATITLAGDQFTTTGMGAVYTGRLELFPRSKPRRLAMHFATGPEAGNTNHGIYEIDGDSWRLCLNTRGGAAPKAFVSSKEDVLETLRRPEPKLAAVTGEPIQAFQGEWQMVSCLRSGEPLPPSFLKTGRRTVEGIQTTLSFGGQPYQQSTLTADGPGQFRLGAQLGVYELDGDRLTTCLGPAGSPRPAGYASTKEGGETLTTWRRRR